MVKIESSLFNKYDDLVSLTEYSNQRPELRPILGQMNHRRVIVSAATLKVLKEAQDLNITVKHDLPLGAANQVVNIWDVKGKSRIAASYVDKSKNLAEESVGLGTYQCGGFGATSFERAKSKITDRPIFLIGDRTLGHVRLLFGDPRDPRWAEHNTVSQDAWHPLATACTLSEAQFNEPNFDQVFNVHYSAIDANPGHTTEFNPPPPCSLLPDDAVLNKKSMRIFGTPMGPELVDQLIQPGPSSFHTTTGTKDISTIYVDQNGNQGQFGLLPKKIVDDYLNAHNEISASEKYGNHYFQTVAQWPHSPPEESGAQSKSISWPTAVREAIDKLALPDWDWNVHGINNLMNISFEDASDNMHLLLQSLLENLGQMPEPSWSITDKLKVIEYLGCHLDTLSTTQYTDLMKALPNTIRNLYDIPSDRQKEIIRPLIDLIDADLISESERSELSRSMIESLDSAPLDSRSYKILKKHVAETLGTSYKRQKTD